MEKARPEGADLEMGVLRPPRLAYSKPAPTQTGAVSARQSTISLAAPCRLRQLVLSSCDNYSCLVINSRNLGSTCTASPGWLRRRNWNIEGSGLRTPGLMKAPSGMIIVRKNRSGERAAWHCCPSTLG